MTVAAVQLDECLSIRDGRLAIEGHDVAEIAARFGTPLYVISEGQLRRNLRVFKQEFQVRWPDGQVVVMPSIKANHSLALRQILNQEGAGCDTFGPGELHAALASGVPADLISVNGSSKTRALIEKAAAAGARITLDSSREVELVAALGKPVRVRLRVRPDADTGAPSDFYPEAVSLRDAFQRYKPGIPTEELESAARRLLAAPHVELTGVMMHMGRQTTDLEAWAAMVRALAKLIAHLRDATGGWQPREIDVGGGFAVPRDPFARADPQRRDAPAAPSVAGYAEAITRALRAELANHGIPATARLEVEPGRSLYGNAGIHLATVTNLKRQTSPLPYTWIETDTSEVFLADVNIERNRWTVVAATKASAPPAVTADVVGISCGLDVIVPAAELPEIAEGEVLAFLDTGAYQDASASNFNAMPRPATVLVSETGVRVIRRAETIEEVFARDRVTERRIDHVGVTVSNLDRAIDFYCGVLGLELLDRSRLDSPDLAALLGLDAVDATVADLDSGDGRIVELIQYHAPSGRVIDYTSSSPASMHIAFRVDDLEAVRERLRASNARVISTRPITIGDPGGRWDGATCLYIRDPDGAVLELVQRPRGV